jgi:hypothetical protein
MSLLPPLPTASGTKLFFSELGKDVYDTSLTLFIIMIPAIIIVKVAQELGGIELLASFIEPLMSGLGLPESVGLVWAMTIATNLYGGMIVFADLDASTSLTVAQMSVLGCLILTVHGLPVEVAVAKKAGVNVWIVLLTRVGGGILFAWTLHQIYSTGNYLQQPAEVIFKLQPSTDNSLLGWAVVQLKNLAMIVVIIGLLMFGLKLLRVLGIERLMGIILRPFLWVFGIGKEATSFAIIGITLGLSFGGGLIINEAKKGEIPARDVFSTIILLGLLHSLIEDTLLIMLLGADFISIFWGRLLFVVVFVGIFVRLVGLLSEETCQRFLYRSLKDDDS